MATAFKVLCLTFALTLGTATLAAVSAPNHSEASTAPVSDPDPSDCPFCGGNPQAHWSVMYKLEKALARVQLRLLL